MQIKTILVPTDFSEYAERAFHWATSIAADWGAKIVLLHVGPTMSHLAFPESIYLTDLKRMENDLLADAENRIQAFAAKKGASAVSVETRVVVGEPSREICQVAAEVDAELIVMGSHGRTGLSHILLGSVAERVVRHSSCPVLVVRSPRTVAQ